MSETGATGLAPLPWHAAALEQVRAWRTSGRMPHALLLHGPPGLGKLDFARLFAQRCLCEEVSAEALPCGRCRGCRLYAAQTHPDLHVVQPEEGKATLAIDQIRELAATLALQPHTAPVKVAVIVPADAMTLAAANALLKTLEEPPGSAVLVLITARPGRLPPTVRSRCQAIRFQAPALEEAIAWLRANAPRPDAPWPELLTAAGGAPLRALELAESGAGDAAARFAADLQGIASGRTDPCEAAMRWAAMEPSLWWDWLQGHVAALVRGRLAAEKSGAHHSAPAGRLPDYVRELDSTALLDYWDALLAAKRHLDGQANPQLVLESLLVPWAHRLVLTAGPTPEGAPRSRDGDGM
jgi:DNA polymerase-3 subunit delta'